MRFWLVARDLLVAGYFFGVSSVAWGDAPAQWQMYTYTGSEWCAGPAGPLAWFASQASACAMDVAGTNASGSRCSTPSCYELDSLVPTGCRIHQQWCSGGSESYFIRPATEGCPTGGTLENHVCVGAPPAACEPSGTAPETGMVWDSEDCRWEYSSCATEGRPTRPINPAEGWYPATARWCSGGCQNYPATSPQGGQYWQPMNSGCPANEEGHSDPPLPNCEPGEWRNPVTGVCSPACLADQTRDPQGVCQWNACPEGQFRNPEGHCVVGGPEGCPAGQHWSTGLRQCVSDDPACPPGTVRQPGGNCLAAPMPPDVANGDTTVVVVDNGDGSTTTTTTTVSTGPGGTATTVTTTRRWANGSMTSSTRTTGTGPQAPVQPVEFEPGEGPNARSWEEINSEFFDRVKALPVVEAAESLSGAFPTGGSCPFGSIELPWGSVSMSFVCDIWGDVSGVISASMMAVWSVVGILILLSA